MGHPSCIERGEFIDLKLDAGNNRTYHICKHCNAAYRASRTTAEDVHRAIPLHSPSSEPVRIIGRPENYRSHLKSCGHYIAYVVSRRAADAAARPSSPARFQASGLASGSMRSSDDDASSTHSAKRQKRIDQFFSGASSDAEGEILMRILVEFQADNRLPDSFIERLSTARLLRHVHKMITDLFPLPNRKKLGGPVLDAYAVDCESQDSTALREVQVNAEGARVNFLSDVWQNICRAHVLGCQLVLFGSGMTYALLPTGARHDALAIAEQMEEVMEQMANDGWKVGAVITDNAGQCGRARRILSLRYPRISFQICFAHDLNNLVKAVLKSDFSVVTKEESDAVNALNASSAKWLVEARTSMADTYGYFLSLKQLCETRWNSMHGCFASLLRVKSALELLEFKFRDAADFPDAVRVFRSASFWARLKDAEEVVRPLSFASLKLQRDENSLADVVVCYLDIFMGFSARAVGTRNLIREVERRWNQCEQPLMLLALFLHPVHMKAGQKLLNKTPHTTIGSLCQIGVYYFRRFTGENPGSLGEYLYNWLKGKLALPPEGGFSSVNTFWDFMRDDMPGSKLPTLAMLVLSIVVNTATCERYFSELALIHTAKRNKMSVEKARKIAAIRKKVRESDHLDEILKSDRIKKLTNPTERRRRQDDRFECNQADAEEESDGETGSDLGSDDAFEYWGAVLAGLEEDEDLSPSYSRAVSSNGAAVARSTDSIHNRDNSSSSTPDRGQNAAAERAREEREFREKISEIAEQATEAIPEPIKHPFPAFNDRNFPQEIFLTGLRGQKISLAELCQASQVTSEDPVWHFASPVRFNQVVHR